MDAKQCLNRRQFLQAAGTVAAATALAACTPQAPAQPTKAAEPAGQPTAAYETGEISILLCCSGPEEQAAKEEFNKRFMETHPGVKINQEPMPAGQNYFEKLQTVIAAGTAPDIYDMWEGYVQPYAKNGALVNLEPFLEKDGRLKKSDLWEGGLAAVSWEGKLYSMLIAVMPGPVSMFYNKKQFTEAGIEFPTSDMTWNQMREKALALTKASGGDVERYGLVFALWFVPWTYWIWSNGGDVFNRDETKCVIDQAKAVEAIQFWGDLVAKDKVAPTSATASTMRGESQMFRSGVASMYLGNCWDLFDLNAAKEEGLEWGACLAPKANDGNRVFYQHTWCWGIWTGTKKVNTCWEYARDFVTDEQMMTSFMAVQRAVPSVKSLLKVFLSEETKELGWDGVPSIIGDVTKLRYPGAGAKWDKISSMIQAEVFDLVFIGEKTAADATKEVVPKVDEELARG